MDSDIEMMCLKKFTLDSSQMTQIIEWLAHVRRRLGS